MTINKVISNNIHLLSLISNEEHGTPSSSRTERKCEKTTYTLSSFWKGHQPPAQFLTNCHSLIQRINLLSCLWTQNCQSLQLKSSIWNSRNSRLSWDIKLQSVTDQSWIKCTPALILPCPPVLLNRDQRVLMPFLWGGITQKWCPKRQLLDKTLAVTVKYTTSLSNCHETDMAPFPIGLKF